VADGATITRIFEVKITVTLKIAAKSVRWSYHFDAE